MNQVKFWRITALLLLAAMAFAYAGVASANDDEPNCCDAAGWECTVHSEWVAGYYAYIRGECTTQAQSGEVQDAAPNCCNSPGWECTAHSDWVSGYYAYQRGECSDGVPQSVPPAGSGSASVTIGKWTHSASFARAFHAEAAANPWSRSLHQNRDLPEPEYTPLTELPDETSPAEAVVIRNENIRYLFTCGCAVANTGP